MKSLILLYLLFTSQDVLSISINNLLGDFETISIDGKNIKAGPNQARSITNGLFKTSPVFYNLNREPLETLQLVLFTGYTPVGPGWYGYHSIILFPEDANIVVDDKVLTYKINKKILYLKNYAFKEIDFKMKLTLSKVEQLLFLSIFHQSKARGITYYKKAQIKEIHHD